YRPLRAPDARRTSSPIGRPIPDLRLHVLDRRMEPVPYGVPGEIYVGGAGLARGYLGRPDLTAERFLADPFGDRPGARLYGRGDRCGLPAPERARPGLQERYAAPRTPEEKALSDVWSEVLGLERIGIDDNFFTLCGDSIRSIQVRVKAGERGLDLSLQQIFTHQTIRGLAADLARVLPGGAPARRPGAFDLVSPEDRRRLPEDVEDAYPLSRLQEGFVFHSEYSADYIIYVSSVEIRAPFLRDRLEAALRRLVDRHAILRTSFDLAGFGEPLQLVHKSAAIP